ncbi:MAG: Dephospho-CoA kinase [Desulfovibrio sp.]
MAGYVNPKLYRTRHAPGQDAYSRDTPARVFHVPEGQPPCRLDAFLGETLRPEGYSREKIKLAITEGGVTRNGEPCAKPNSKIFPGDEIAISLPPAHAAPAPENGNLTVIWHDEHLAVLNKPAGLTVHPAPGLDDGTLVNRLLHHFPQLAAQGGLRPGIVHRLDKDTSGLMLVALTEKARLALTDAFAARTVTKEYLALVYGVPRPQTGTIDAAIGRSPENKTKMAVLPVTKGGKEALSEYVTLYAGPHEKFSLVRVAIHTGRTHQIRVHMRHIGHPLLGDAAYALPGRPTLPVTAARQMLHAWKLSFTHPETGETMTFYQRPPEDFTSLAIRLALPMQRVVVTGSPGGGKSTLTHALQGSGMPGWSADDAVRNLYEKDADGWYLLQRRFGQRFVPDENQGVDKKALFAAMLESEQLRLEVEHLVHPLVRHDLESFWREQEERGVSAAVAEIPLALETGWLKARQSDTQYGDSELLVTVYCPFAIRHERLAENRGWPESMIAAMESWQWPEDKKAQAADLVADNSGSLETFRHETEKVVQTLAELRAKMRETVERHIESLWTAPGNLYS